MQANEDTCVNIPVVHPLSTLHVFAFICKHPKLSQLVCLDKVDKVDRLQLEAEAVDGLGGDLDGGVGVEAGVELDGVADGLEDVSDVAGDVDEHEGVELCRGQRCRAAVVAARADVADGVRAGDGGAEERDGAWLADVEVRR